MIVREYAELVGSTSPLCQINSDHYKPLLLPKTGEDPEHGAKTYWESGQVRQRAVDRLDEMIDQDRAPDFWVSTMTPSPERMQIAGKGGAKVNIYVVTCPVERAYRRATNPDPRNEDYLRFLSTESILENHKQVSALLPSALAEARRDLRIYDTATRPTVLIASMDSYHRELRVFDAGAFVAFVRQSFINEKAAAPEQVYVGVDDRKVAAALCEYPKIEVSLNFRYCEATPNLALLRIRTMPIPVEEGGLTKQQADQLRQLMLTSQPEAYLWVGEGRALIPDFQAFVRLLQYTNLIQPHYAPILAIEEIGGVSVLVIWCPGGQDRPYRVPKDVTAKEKDYAYYIRRFASTIIAKNGDLKELQALAPAVPFDDRLCHTVELADLSLALIRAYLRACGRQPPLPHRRAHPLRRAVPPDGDRRRPGRGPAAAPCRPALLSRRAGVVFPDRPHRSGAFPPRRDRAD
jgi:hypothetical protein